MAITRRTAAEKENTKRIITKVKGDSSNSKTLSFVEGCNTVASIHVSNFPGNCGILILHDATYDEPSDFMELIKAVEEYELDKEGFEAASILMYTHVNADALKILKKAGFVTDLTFTNYKTSNKVEVMTKEIAGREEY